jgi:endo-1,4-beta-xylanase
VIPLYAPDSPNLNQERVREPEKYNMTKGVAGRIQSIVNIHNPSIEIHPADPTVNTGSVIILAAGGGHRTLNVGSEAGDFVHFFYNYGVNTVILRNRLRSDGYSPSKDAVEDALQAIRFVRARATEWGFDPKRIGIIGFSAGAELSGPAALRYVEYDAAHDADEGILKGISSRPDFVGLLYPGPTPFTQDPETTIPRDAPPSFVATPGSGDQVHAVWAMDYATAMLRSGVPNLELHVYANGTHGGGMKDRKGTPLGTWQDRFIDWFRDLGFLENPGVETKAAKDVAEFEKKPPQRFPSRK